jgi:hypothetical protein
VDTRHPWMSLVLFRLFSLIDVPVLPKTCCTN